MDIYEEQAGREREMEREGKKRKGDDLTAGIAYVDR